MEEKVGQEASSQPVEATEAAVQGQESGEIEKTPIFEYNYEMAQWVMTEFSTCFFQNELVKLMTLRETINEKWEEQ
jgi:hypothetical protein